MSEQPERQEGGKESQNIDAIKSSPSNNRQEILDAEASYTR